MASPRPSRFHPPVEIGGYVLQTFLGNGTFAEVYRAIDPSDLIQTQEYAVKIPYPQHIDEGSLTNEALIGLNVSGHKNIIRFVKAIRVQDGPHAGELLLVSDYCNGGTLRDLLKKYPTGMPEAEAIALMEQICAGVAHLHSQKVYHRDLKPENILLHNGIIKIGDFGVSRLTDKSRSMTGYAGTIFYMSPESFDGHYSASVDIWALGVIFYEMLTGCLPFAATDTTQLMKMIIMEPPKPLPSTITPHVKKVVLSAVEKHRRLRIPSAMEFAIQLRSPAPSPPVRTNEPIAQTNNPPQPNLPVPVSVKAPVWQTPFWILVWIINLCTVLVGAVLYGFIYIFVRSGFDSKYVSFGSDQNLLILLSLIANIVSSHFVRHSGSNPRFRLLYLLLYLIPGFAVLKRGQQFIDKRKQ